MHRKMIRDACGVTLALALSGCGMWRSVKDGTAAATQAVFETKVKQMDVVVTARGADQYRAGFMVPEVQRETGHAG